MLQVRSVHPEAPDGPDAAQHTFCNTRRRFCGLFLSLSAAIRVSVCSVHPRTVLRLPGWPWGATRGDTAALSDPQSCSFLRAPPTCRVLTGPDLAFGEPCSRPRFQRCFSKREHFAL